MLRRLIWSILGAISAVLGVVGIILPILPGILFLLLAIFCFAKAADSPGERATPGMAQLRADLDWDRQALRRRYDSRRR